MRVLENGTLNQGLGASKSWGLKRKGNLPFGPLRSRGHGRTLPNNFCVVTCKLEGLLQQRNGFQLFLHTYLHYEQISFYCHQTVGQNFVPFNFISCYTYDSHSRHDAIAMLVLCRLGRQIPLDHAIISIAGKNQFSIIMHAMLMQRLSSSRSSAYNAINSKLEPCWISLVQYLLLYRQVGNWLPCEHTN